jgi:hypothetical protein
MRGGLGCRFYHSASEVFEASRADDRREDSTQWQTRDEHEIPDDDHQDGKPIVSYVGVVRSFRIEPSVPENASSAVSRTVHSVYVVEAAINSNDASEQVANEEATTDGGAQISERVSPRLSVDVKCSPAVDMLEQCAEPAGLIEVRMNVPTDETNA